MYRDCNDFAFLPSCSFINIVASRFLPQSVLEQILQLNALAFSIKTLIVRIFAQKLLAFYYNWNTLPSNFPIRENICLIAKKFYSFLRNLFKTIFETWLTKKWCRETFYVFAISEACVRSEKQRLSFRRYQSFFFSMKISRNYLSFMFLSTGCACRFLYGPETKDEHKGQIEKSLDGKLELKLEVIFYKKNGKRTWAAALDDI